MRDYVPLMQTILWIALIVAAALLFRPELSALRPALMARIEGGSALKMGPVEFGELKQEVASVRTEVNDLNDRVYKLFLLTMSPDMFNNLMKLASGTFGSFEKTGGLERELRHLRDLGYVDVPSVGFMPKRGDELLDYVSVTPTGMQFVELRESLQRSGG